MLANFPRNLTHASLEVWNWNKFSSSKAFFCRDSTIFFCQTRKGKGLLLGVSRWAWLEMVSLGDSNSSSLEFLFLSPSLSFVNVGVKRPPFILPRSLPRWHSSFWRVQSVLMKWRQWCSLGTSHGKMIVWLCLPQDFAIISHGNIKGAREDWMSFFPESHFNQGKLKFTEMLTKECKVNLTLHRLQIPNTLVEKTHSPAKFFLFLSCKSKVTISSSRNLQYLFLDHFLKHRAVSTRAKLSLNHEHSP